MACSGGARWCASPASGPARCCAGGRKLVGISQRRTRAGARFQCAVHVRVVAGPLTPLLAGPLPDRPLPDVATLPADVAAALPAAVAAAPRAA